MRKKTLTIAFKTESSWNVQGDKIRISTAMIEKFIDTHFSIRNVGERYKSLEIDLRIRYRFSFIPKKFHRM